MSVQSIIPILIAPGSTGGIGVLTLTLHVVNKARHCRRWMVQCYSTGDSNVSFHQGTLVPPGEYDWTCASFSPIESTTETVQFIRLCTDDRRVSLYFTTVCLFPPHNCPFLCWHLDLI